MLSTLFRLQTLDVWRPTKTTDTAFTLSCGKTDNLPLSQSPQGFARSDKNRIALFDALNTHKLPSQAVVVQDC